MGRRGELPDDQELPEGSSRTTGGTPAEYRVPGPGPRQGD